MGHDLDDSELRATRKLLGVDKENNIEKDIKNIKQYINLVLSKGYCDCNELNVISTGKYCDGSKNVAYSMQNILTERKADKNKIEELDDELWERVKQCKNMQTEIDRLYTDKEELQQAYLHEKLAKEEVEELLEESIPKQKIKNKIEELKNRANGIAGTYQYADSGDDLIEKKNKVIELRTKAEALEELLQESEDK